VIDHRRCPTPCTVAHRGHAHAVPDLGPARAVVDAAERDHRHLVAEAVVPHLWPLVIVLHEGGPSRGLPTPPSMAGTARCSPAPFDPIEILGVWCAWTSRIYIYTTLDFLVRFVRRWIVWGVVSGVQIPESQSRIRSCSCVTEHKLALAGSGCRRWRLSSRAKMVWCMHLICCFLFFFF